MSIVNLIKTSLYSIKAHKFRVFLTMIGIIIGISSTVTIKSIGDGLSDYITSSMESSNSNQYQVYFTAENEELSSDMMNYFDDYDIDEIKSVTGVKDVEAVTSSGSSDYVYGNLEFFNKSAQAFLTYSESDNMNIKYGRWFNKGEDRSDKIVINEDVANNLFSNAEEAVGRGVTFNGEVFEVIGVTEKSSNLLDYFSSYYCFTAKESVQSITDSDSIYSIYVYIDPKLDKDEVLNEVFDLLKKNHSDLNGEYEVYDSSADIQLITTIIGALTTFVTAITGISLFVGGVGVMNIMYVSVTERRREIGIRRAIGAKPITILFQFLFEAVLVTGVGGIIGILIGYILGNVLSPLIPIEGFKAIITAKTLIGSASISVIVGIVFGIIPARNASKLDPIKAIYQ